MKKNQKKLLPSLSVKKIAVMSIITAQAAGFLPSAAPVSKAFAAEPAKTAPPKAASAQAAKSGTSLSKATWIWYTLPPLTT